MPATLPLFADHTRAWQSNRYVYPVISRRSRGLSIGVNLNPDKACNYDCIYCCVDRSQPSEVREVDLNVVRQELRQMLDLAAGGALFQSPPFDQAPPDLRRLNDVAFSGDGEPTSCPQFLGACEVVAGVLAERGLSDVKIVVITNATLLHRPQVAEALVFLDGHQGEIWCKLEAGTQEYYKLVERTTIPLRQVLDNIAAAGTVRPIVIQSLFMRIHGEPPAPSEIQAYLDRLGELVGKGCRIKLVQVYTVARRTTETYVTPISDAEIDAIVASVRSLGLAAEGFYGPG